MHCLVCRRHAARRCAEFLPGLSSLPLPHMILPGIRSEGDLVNLAEARGNRMASFDLTPQYRCVPAVNSPANLRACTAWKAP